MHSCGHSLIVCIVSLALPAVYKLKNIQLINIVNAEARFSFLCITSFMVLLYNYYQKLVLKSKLGHGGSDELRLQHCHKFSETKPEAPQITFSCFRYPPNAKICITGNRMLCYSVYLLQCFVCSREAKAKLDSIPRTCATPTRWTMSFIWSKFWLPFQSCVHMLACKVGQTRTLLCVHGSTPHASGAAHGRLCKEREREKIYLYPAPPLIK